MTHSRRDMTHFRAYYLSLEMYDMTHSSATWLILGVTSLIFGRIIFHLKCTTWLIASALNMTCLILHVWLDSSHSATWLILQVCHDSWKAYYLPLETCDMTHSIGYVYAMTHSTCVKWLLPQCNIFHSRRDMTHWELRHDLLHQLCAWHDCRTFRVKVIIRLSQVLSHM